MQLWSKISTVCLQNHPFYSILGFTFHFYLYSSQFLPLNLALFSRKELIFDSCQLAHLKILRQVFHLAELKKTIPILNH
jgi:hypothetical protein